MNQESMKHTLMVARAALEITNECYTAAVRNLPKEGGVIINSLSEVHLYKVDHFGGEPRWTPFLRVSHNGHTKEIPTYEIYGDSDAKHLKALTSRIEELEWRCRLLLKEGKRYRDCLTYLKHQSNELARESNTICKKTIREDWLY